MVHRSSPSQLRRLLPFGAFLATFTVVMMLLVFSMDLKSPRPKHDYNWTGDDEFVNVPQESSKFVDYIREKFLKPPSIYPHASIQTVSMAPQSQFVGKLFSWKRGGSFVEAGAYRRDRSSDTEWLEKELGWHGLLIQPDPKDYSNLVKRNRTKSYSINACISPTPYPKEVTFRLSNKSLMGVKTSYARVKCFPLMSLLLAANLTSVDYLSLDAESAEIQVMKTLPFDRVKISVISVKWLDIDNKHLLVEFMANKQYRLIKTFNNFHLFLVNKIRI